MNRCTACLALALLVGCGSSSSGSSGSTTGSGAGATGSSGASGTTGTSGTSASSGSTGGNVVSGDLGYPVKALGGGGATLNCTEPSLVVSLESACASSSTENLLYLGMQVPDGGFAPGSYSIALGCGVPRAVATFHMNGTDIPSSFGNVTVDAITDASHDEMRGSFSAQFPNIYDGGSFTLTGHFDTTQGVPQCLSP